MLVISLFELILNDVYVNFIKFSTTTKYAK